MAHLEPEDLAASALGEQLDAALREHLRACPACTAEEAAYGRVLAAAELPDQLEAPPERVWDRIEGELFGPTSGTSSSVSPTTTAPVTSTTTPAAGPVTGPATAPPASSASSVPPADRPRRRRGRTAWVIAASVVIGAGGGVAVERALSADSDGVLLASAELEPLPGWSVPGTAEVRERDGLRELVVNLPDDSHEGYQEVWLISTDLTRLQSIGILEGASGTFALPPGLDLDDFAVVDVSDEPFDGDPNHSGASIVRGELRGT